MGTRESKFDCSCLHQLAEPATAEAASDGRMTKEQLGELAEALSILSAKSSIVKEKEELKQLMETNISSEEVGIASNDGLSARPTNMIF